MDLHEARTRLETMGAKRFPGRLAAFLGLEPEAIELSARLLRAGVREAEIEEAAEGACDPGAALVALAERVPYGVPEEIWQRAEGRYFVHQDERDDAEKLLWKGMSSPESWRALMRGATEAGDPLVAAEWFNRAVNARHKDTELLYETLIESATRMAERALARLEGQNELEELVRQKLASETTLWGEEDPRIAELQILLARMLVISGKNAEAEALARKAISTRQKATGEQVLTDPSPVVTLAKALENQGKYEEAEQLLRKAMTFAEASLGSNHAPLDEYRRSLSSVLRKQGRHAEADLLLRKER